MHPAPSPKVTVIIATYNNSRSLALTLQTVLIQDLKDFEVWVIGDACADDSEKIVHDFNDPRLHWHNLPQNSGSQSAPNNEGLRRACGEYIAYLGHDDLWFPWHLSTLVGRIESAHADLVHDLCALISPEGVRDAIGAPNQGVRYGDHFVPPSTWLHRRSLAEEIGGWRDADTLIEGVDIDFTHRICKANKRIEFLDSLGVLKFPSPWWKSYSRKDAPQSAYAGSLHADPLKLHNRALLDLALAREFQDPQFHRNTVQTSFRLFLSAMRELIFALGRSWVKHRVRENSLIMHFLRYRFRRLRQKLRLRRGLPPV